MVAGAERILATHVRRGREREREGERGRGRERERQIARCKEVIWR